VVRVAGLGAGVVAAAATPGAVPPERRRAVAAGLGGLALVLALAS
jgi:hypothetical protein